ncbi:MAG: ATP-binding protein [Holophagaceae bacterium]|nr:ATP-binding protein [Holophagaceae bacterium]
MAKQSVLKVQVLDSSQVQKLVQLVDESVRASSEGVRHFVEPTPGVLAKSKSKRHNIIFGRRGSGKSSLLQKIAADLTVDRTPIAMVDLETFKQHSYPDVLLSILIKSFLEVKNWLDTAATNSSTKTTFWNRLFGTVPTKPGFNREATHALSADFDKMILELNTLLMCADESKIRDSSKGESGNENKASLSAKVPGTGIGAEVTAGMTEKTSSETQTYT